eukprot:GHVU01046248.1.p1 GENE.GHVU01046248.1~~GHVU01046248.1.p1  ORF type:complete len:149 (+),score=20.22 GHVU01046248.1:543-989(+)
MQIWAVDDLERNGHLVVKLRTLDPEVRTEFLPYEVPGPAGDSIRIHTEGGLVITPVSTSSSKLAFAWSVNPKEKISTAILNFFTSVFMKMGFNAFKKACVNAKGGEYEKRRQENRYLYGFVEERLQELKLFGVEISEAPVKPKKSGLL